MILFSAEVSISSSCSLLVRMMYLHPANLGSTLAGTLMSHWWRQEGQSSQNCSHAPVKSYLSRHVSAVEQASPRC